MSVARLKTAYQGLKAFSQRYRWPLTGVGAAILVAGVAWSVQRLELDPANIEPRFLALVALTLIPAGMVVAAINLQLMGRVVGTQIGFRTALTATVYGRIAEVLPLPGAAMVRGATLMHSGAKMGETVTIMVWSSLLSLAMVGLVASAPLIMAMPMMGWGLAAASALVSLVSCIWLRSHSSVGLVCTMLAIRVVNIALSVLRFWACFAAIGFALPLVTSALFVIAGSVTTYIGIVPGGLGISESLSAGLALLIKVEASAAFLAAAVNRLLGLSMAGVGALVLTAPKELQFKEAS